MVTIAEKQEKKDDIVDIENKNIFFAKFNKSCLITYIGILFGVLSMYFAFIKVAFIDACFVRYSLACLIMSGICDMYDGKFARRCKRTEEEKAFGVQLDSLADTFCFIATPVVIMLCMGMTKWYYLFAYVFFVICGVSRLGYFNIEADLNEAVKIYKGLPVTSTAIIYPLVGLLHLFISVECLSIIYCIVTIVTGLLFVLNIKIPKLKGVAYKIIPIIAILVIVLLLVLK